MDCVFCEIVKGNLNCKKIYEDDDVLAFYDLEPVAPVHFLVIPKKHIESLSKAEESDFLVVSKIFSSIKKIAEKLGLSNGFRVVNNCGEDGGQTVMHMHFHVLAERKMSWPPG